MTILLAVETSAALCSVAVHADGRWTEDTQNVERLHNQVLLRQIDAVSRRAGVQPRSFECVAFGAGPGSFTGVRIAAATAQAVALASGAAVIAIRSSAALAECVRLAWQQAGLPGVVTVTRSRRDAHYVAVHAFDGHGCRLVLEDALHQGMGPPSLRDFRGWPGAGDRPDWWIESDFGAPFLSGMAATAGIVGRLALDEHAAGRAGPPEAGLPVYVSGDSPWRAQNEARASGSGAPSAAAPPD